MGRVGRRTLPLPPLHRSLTPLHVSLVVPDLLSPVPAGDSCCGCCFPAPKPAALLSPVPCVPCVPCTSGHAGAGSGRAPAWAVGPAPSISLAVQAAGGIFCPSTLMQECSQKSPTGGVIQSPPEQSEGWFTTPPLPRLPKRHGQALEPAFSPVFTVLQDLCVRAEFNFLPSIQRSFQERLSPSC